MCKIELNSNFNYHHLLNDIEKLMFKSNKIPSVKLVKKILDDELEMFHSLKSLADRTFVSPVYLSRSFKVCIGITISKYQLKTKLVNARYLLLHTSNSIKDISYINGFYDDSHFIRSFKNEFGVSPNKFRNHFKVNHSYHLKIIL